MTNPNRIAPPPGPQPSVVYPVAPVTYPQAVPQPQSFAAPSNFGLGAQIAAATMGAEKLPYLSIGEYLLQIERTLCPQQSRALVAEFVVISSSNPEVPEGAHRKWYQSLTAQSVQADKAQKGAVLAFCLRALGADSVEELAESGWSAQAIAETFDKFLVDPGPVSGRQIRVTVTDSGKRTRTGIDPQTNQQYGGQPILNYVWAVA